MSVSHSDHPSGAPPMLEARNVRKTYGGVTALDDVSFVAGQGHVHALLGENGAGKSTLIKVIVGVTRPDSGVLFVDGEEVSFSNTADAANHGVAVVSQELNLFPEFDVIKNMFTMREPRRGPFISRREMEAMARPVLKDLGLDISLRAPLAMLSLAEQQLVEIGKALVTDPRVLILDEPTSALEATSVRNLMRVIDVLRDRQVAVVFVSHILEEVMALCDEITVLRDGRPALERVPRSELTVPAIIEAMLGHAQKVVPRGADARPEMEAAAARSVEEVARDGELRFDEVSVPGRLHDVDLSVKRGEVVGLAGVGGAGQQTILEVLAGLRHVSSGQVTMPDGERAARNPTNAYARGVGLVTGDRRRLGLMLDKPIWTNVAQVSAVALTREWHLIRKPELRRRAERYRTELNIRTPSVNHVAGSLSGGNQQKVVFAKWLDMQPSILLLDDPSRGVDIGAKAEMYELIHAIAGAGTIVLMCSTDAEELANVCHRVVVMRHGRVATELSGQELSSHAILEAINLGQLEGVGL